MNESINDKGLSPIRKSVRVFEQMLENNTGYSLEPSEFANVVDYYLFKDRFSDAVNAVNYALKLHPNSLSLRLKKVHLLIDRNKLASAFDLLQRLQKKAPQEPEIYYLFGAVYIEKENFEVAEKFFNKSISLGFDTADQIAGMGFLFEQKGAYKSAVKFLDKAYRIDNEKLFVLFETAYCYEKMGEFKRSIFFYEKYLNEDPFSEIAWYNIGVAAEKIKLFAKAIDAYEFAIALQPEFPEALAGRADLLKQSGECTKAIRAYEEYLKLVEEDESAIEKLADCYERVKDYKNAEYYHQKALALGAKS